MKKFKILFSGFSYVEANSPEEAENLFDDDGTRIYSECQVDRVEEVDDFVVDWEARS